MDLPLAYASFPVKTVNYAEGWVYGSIEPRRTGESHTVDLSAYRLRDYVGGLGAKVLPLSSSLFLDLANVADDPQEIAFFIKEYGLFDLDNLRHNSDLPDGLREYFERRREFRRIPFAIQTASFKKAQQEIRAMVVLLRSVQTQDAASAQEVSFDLKLVQGSAEAFPEWAEDVLAAFKQRSFRAAELEVLEKEPGEVIALVSPYGVRPAAILSSAYAVAQNLPLAICERDDCRKLFHASRLARRFCSTRCQNLKKVHRHRKKQKEQ